MYKKDDKKEEFTNVIKRMKNPYNNLGYDELSKLVNERYRELLDEGVDNATTVLRKEFRLSTSVVWEFLGIKDQLDFIDSEKD